MKTWINSVLAALVFFAGTTDAHEHEAAMRALNDSKIQSWLDNPIVLSAVRKQNTRNVSLTQQEIERLDRQWRAETQQFDRPLIESVLRAPLSNYLKGVKERAHGLYTEIFVMDNKGLNVGQSDVTSDYWQGDEPKWTMTVEAGRNAVHIGEIEEDESTQMFQSQLSLTLVDPETGGVVGAVCVGVNLEALLE